MAGDLLPAIRLPFLRPEFIADHIENDILFREDRCSQQLIMEALKYHLLPDRRSSMLLGARARPRKATVGTMYAVGGMDSSKSPLAFSLPFPFPFPFPFAEPPLASRLELRELFQVR